MDKYSKFKQHKSKFKEGKKKYYKWETLRFEYGPQDLIGGNRSRRPLWPLTLNQRNGT